MFDISTSKSIDEGKLILSKIFSKDCIEFVGRTRENNGIKGYTKIIDKIKPNPSNTISISQVGTIATQLRKNSWYASQNIFILKANDNQLINLFVVASINYVINAMFDDGYSNYPTLEKLITLKIQLPINRDGDIDFEFMESFVAELEAERVAELEAYLAAASLKDYELTTAELSALSKFENYNWGEFEYRKIFNHIKQGKRLKKDDQICGDLPFVMAGITNNGVANYISNPIIMFPKNSITVDIFGNVFYRDFEFSAGDDTGVYWNDKREFSKEIMLFFTTAMSKSLLGKYSFGNKLRSSKSFNIAMELPTNNGDIDFEFMNNFIKAIKKLVIKDVVLYTDNKIKATKSIVSSNQ